MADYYFLATDADGTECLWFGDECVARRGVDIPDAHWDGVMAWADGWDA